MSQSDGASVGRAAGRTRQRLAELLSLGAVVINRITKKITYEIEDTNVATIDQETGIITATNAGETKVKISVDDNLDDYSLIVDEENIEQEIDNEVNENYLEKANDD